MPAERLTSASQPRPPKSLKKCFSHNLLDTNKQASLSKMQDFVRLVDIVLDYRKTSQFAVRCWALVVGRWVTQLSTIDYQLLRYCSSLTFSIHSTTFPLSAS